MCGITGYWSKLPIAELDLRAQVTRMADSMFHRGPDDGHSWADADSGIALGFRRLAILDLSPTGRQPMASASGRHVIVFNGEIYNFAALRDELSALGHQFRGGSDTEVLVTALEEWGVTATARRCNGMFAFAVWSRAERSLTLARSRLGVKPLYYGVADDGLIFGSELKALRAHPGFCPEVDRTALTLFLRRSVVPSPFTIYRAARQLPPGCTIRFTSPDLEGAVPEPFWSLREIAERGRNFAGSPGEAVEQLDALLRDAVKLRMVADVPLGALLSGGIDSSTITAVMQAQSTQPVRTFSIGFEENAFNEAHHAAAVAKHLGTNHTELKVTSGDARTVIPLLPEIYDEPFADSSQIPTLMLAELTRRDVTSCLSGDGGDELFGGYARYHETERFWRRFQRVPASARSAAATLLESLDAAGLLPDRIRRRIDVLRCGTAEALYDRSLGHWRDPASIVIGGAEPPVIFNDPARWPRGGTLMDRMMFIDSVSYLPDDIFTKVDRATMAMSLEARVPMLDHRIVEFAWRLPMNLLVRQGQGKWILREVLHRYVPEALVSRPKMGFNVPIGLWLRGPLRAWAEELLDAGRLQREGFFHPELIRKKWAAHLSGAPDRELYLWDVLMFQAWHQRWGTQRNATPASSFAPELHAA